MYVQTERKAAILWHKKGRQRTVKIVHFMCVYLVGRKIIMSPVHFELCSN